MLLNRPVNTSAGEKTVFDSSINVGFERLKQNIDGEQQNIYFIFFQ